MQTDALDRLLIIAAAVACWETGLKTETIGNGLMPHSMLSPDLTSTTLIVVFAANPIYFLDPAIH